MGSLSGHTVITTTVFFLQVCDERVGRGERIAYAVPWIVILLVRLGIWHAAPKFQTIGAVGLGVVLGCLPAVVLRARTAR